MPQGEMRTGTCIVDLNEHVEKRRKNHRRVRRTWMNRRGGQAPFLWLLACHLSEVGQRRLSSVFWHCVLLAWRYGTIKKGLVLSSFSSCWSCRLNAFSQGINIRAFGGHTLTLTWVTPSLLPSFKGPALSLLCSWGC